MTDDLSRFRALAEEDPVEAQRVLRAVMQSAWIPHEGGQRDVIDSTARFRVVRAGRRYGKTELGAREMVLNGLSQPGTVVWWVSNRWRNTRRGYRKVLQQLPTQLLAKPAPADTSNELSLHLKNGTMMEFYSGQNPGSLIGEGVTFVVVDEAALMREDVWFQHIRPTLMDTGGRALLISTPRGRNWFWKLWNYGQDPARATYDSWHFPQSMNPYIPAEETEEARETLPRIIFEQEIMAEFVANAASIFQLGEGAIKPGLAAPQGQVYVGVDLGKKEDFTVISASRAHDRLPVLHERLNEITWPAQRDAIRDAVSELEAYPAVESVTILVDAQGVGDVVFDDLADEGLDTIPISFSGPWKDRAVRQLAADLERGRAFITQDQVREFEAYEYEITEAGKYKYSAVTGHDDEVSAKLLEHWGIVHESLPEPEEDEEPEEEIEEIRPDSPAEIMDRPEAWT